MGSQPLVGFTGCRSLPSRFSPLVGAVVQSVVRSGRGVAVGDASGADAFVRLRAAAVWGFASRLSSAAPASGLLPSVPAVARHWPLSSGASSRFPVGRAASGSSLGTAFRRLWFVPFSSLGGARAWSALSLLPARCIRVPASAWCPPVPRCGALGALVLAPGPRWRLRSRWGCPWSSLPAGSALGPRCPVTGAAFGSPRVSGGCGARPGASFRSGVRRWACRSRSRGSVSCCGCFFACQAAIRASTRHSFSRECPVLLSHTPVSSSLSREEFLDDRDFERIMVLGAVLCYLSGMIWHVMFRGRSRDNMTFGVLCRHIAG